MRETSLGDGPSTTKDWVDEKRERSVDTICLFTADWVDEAAPYINNRTEKCLQISKIQNNERWDENWLRYCLRNNPIPSLMHIKNYHVADLQQPSFHRGPKICEETNLNDLPRVLWTFLLYFGMQTLCQLWIIRIYKCPLPSLSLFCSKSLATCSSRRKGDRENFCTRACSCALSATTLPGLLPIPSTPSLLEDGRRRSAVAATG